MITPEYCPACGSHLEGDAILNTRVVVCQHNGVFTFRCPDCLHEWPIPWLPKPPKDDIR